MTANDPETARELRARASVINALSSSLDRGRNGLASAPGLLRQVLEDGKWRHFITERGEEVRYEQFREFLSTPPLKGLGADEALVRRLVGDDVAILTLLDGELRRPSGRPGTALALDGAEPVTRVEQRIDQADTASIQEPAGSETVNNGDSFDPLPRPRGNTREAAVRRLAQQRPDLLEQVQTGALPSLNAAMIEAGFRERTVSLPISKPEKVAQTLRRCMSRDELRQVVAFLVADEP